MLVARTDDSLERIKRRNNFIIVISGILIVALSMWGKQCSKIVDFVASEQFSVKDNTLYYKSIKDKTLFSANLAPVINSEKTYMSPLYNTAVSEEETHYFYEIAEIGGKVNFWLNVKQGIFIYRVDGEFEDIKTIDLLRKLGGEFEDIKTSFDVRDGKIESGYTFEGLSKEDRIIYFRLRNKNYAVIVPDLTDEWDLRLRYVLDEFTFRLTKKEDTIITPHFIILAGLKNEEDLVKKYKRIKQELSDL